MPVFVVESPPRRRIEKPDAKMLAAALVAAVLAHAIPFVRIVLSALVTLFHEFGHAAASWLLGHPAVPAFDLVYGGGFTHQDNFQLPLAVLVACGFLALVWMLRGQTRVQVAIAAAGGLWLVAVSSEWRREVVVASMGHGGELILAAVFLYMVLANVGWRAPHVERPLGAFLAFFVQIQTMRFAWRLAHDSSFLAWYREGKGGALMNDLETVALDLHIHTGVSVGIEQVASWLFAFSFVTFAAAVAFWALRHPFGARRSVARIDSRARPRMLPVFTEACMVRRRRFLALVFLALGASSCITDPKRPAPATLRIYLARHGQTDWNAARRLQGQTDTELNATGRQQAEKLKERVQGIPLDRVYSSTLRRSRETAEIARGSAPLSSVPGLMEQHVGKFEGQVIDDKHPEAREEFERRSHDPDDSLDGGESENQFLARVRDAVVDLRSESPTGSILVVGHGGTNRAILRVVLELTAEQANSISQANDELYMLELANGVKPRVWKWIDEAHLNEL